MWFVWFYIITRQMVIIKMFIRLLSLTYPLDIHFISIGYPLKTNNNNIVIPHIPSGNQTIPPCLI